MKPRGYFLLDLLAGLAIWSLIFPIILGTVFELIRHHTAKWNQSRTWDERLFIRHVMDQDLSTGTPLPSQPHQLIIQKSTTDTLTYEIEDTQLKRRLVRIHPNRITRSTKILSQAWQPTQLTVTQPTPHQLNLIFSDSLPTEFKFYVR